MDFSIMDFWYPELFHRTHKVHYFESGLYVVCFKIFWHILDCLRPHSLTTTMDGEKYDNIPFTDSTNFATDYYRSNVHVFEITQ